MGSGGGLIGALRATLSIDTAEFFGGFDAADRKAKSSSASIANSIAGIKTAFAGLMAGVSLGAIGAVLKNALDYASSLAEIAQQLGVTTKDLQEYRYAATQVGIAQEDMDKGLSKLTVTMGKARAGAKEPVAAFKTLSDLLGKDILKSAATAGDAIPLIADALAKVKDPAARAALEVALFGKAGQKLDTLLAGGSAAVNELRDAAQSLGIVLSDEQIANADQTADKLAELQKVLEANIASAVADNSRAIYDFVDSLTALVAKIPNVLRWLNNLDLQLQIAGARSAQLNPFLTPGMKGQARGNEALANFKLQRNRLAEQFEKAPKAQRDAMLRFLPDSMSEALGLKGQGGPAGSNPNRSGSTGAGAGDVGDRKRRGKSAEQLAREAERAEEKRKREQAEYEDKLSRSQTDELDARADLSQGVRDRYAAEMARIDSDRTQAANSLALEKGITDEQRKTLAASQEAVFATREVIAERNKNIELIRTDYEIQSAASDAVQNELRGRIDLARSIKERRELELQLLAERKKAEAAYLEMVLSTASPSSSEYQNALTARGTLDKRYGQQQARVEHDNLSPTQQYLDGLPKTAAEIEEAFENAAVNGVKRMNDELADSISSMLGLHGAAGEFLKDLIKIGLQMAQVALFGNGQGGGGGGGGFGGFLSGLGSLLGKGGGSGWGGTSNSAGSMSFGQTAGMSGALAGLAGGGTITVDGHYGVDTNLLSINGMPAARVNRGEKIRVDPNNNNRRDPTVIQLSVEEGALFRPVVRTEAGQVAIQTTTGASRAAARKSRQSLVR